MFNYTFLSFFLFSFLFLFYKIESLPADQSLFPACPINYKPQYYCCDYGKGIQHLYTLYHRPNGNEEIDTLYKEAWYNHPRQVNYPFYRFTPKSPVFLYSKPEEVCRVITNNNKSTSLECGKMQDNSKNPDLFMTYAGNPRNNNATCPEYANFTSLMDRYGYPIEELINKCKTEISITTVSYYKDTKETIFLFFYCFLFLYFLCHLFFLLNIKKQKILKKKRKDKKKEGNNSLVEQYSLYDILNITKEEEANEVKEIERENEKEKEKEKEKEIENETICQIGLNKNIFGSFLYYWTCLLIPIFLLLEIIVIFDQYEFYSSPLLPSGTFRYSVYLILYSLCTFFTFLLVLYRNDIKDFYRVQVSLETCCFVLIKERKNLKKKEEIYIKDSSNISKIMLKIESFFNYYFKTNSKETLNVLVTEHGKRYIEYQQCRYFYDEIKEEFRQRNCYRPLTYKEIYENRKGLSLNQYQENKDILGSNEFTFSFPSILSSFQDEFFQFFYVYTMANFMAWFYLNAYSMGILMTFITLIIGFINIYLKRKRLFNIILMLTKEYKIHVLRNNKWMIRSSYDLVPGDVIEIKKGISLPCDLIVLNGFPICDESMLTGEVKPVLKKEIPKDSNEIYDMLLKSKSHTLFCGTRVIDISKKEEKVLALVYYTKAETSKGKLMRNILHPIPLKFKYDLHLQALIILFLFFALILTLLAVIFLAQNSTLKNRISIFTYAIFTIGGVIHPLMKTFLLLGQIQASKRLEKQKIHCLNPSRLSLAGKLRVFCFDKTGTLTKEGLDYYAIGTYKNNEFNLNIKKDHIELSKELQYALASCHSLGQLDLENSEDAYLEDKNLEDNKLEDKKLEDKNLEYTNLEYTNLEYTNLENTYLEDKKSVKGEKKRTRNLVGNQVEISMFESTKWKLLESEDKKKNILKGLNGEQLEILKVNEFQHHLMSMSVVVKDLLNDKIYMFSKGSFERIKSICNPETIPKDYLSNAEELASKGYYVLSLAYKEIKEQEENNIYKNLEQENLSFLGFLVFKNELKEDTKDSIKELRKGDIRTIIITGDNLQCAVSVALECEMISSKSLILSGEYKQGKVLWKDYKNNLLLSTSELDDFLKKDKNLDYELVVTSESFHSLLDNGNLNKLLLRIRIYARMTPQDKELVLLLHMKKGIITGMCGDGGNDYSALRMAHVGIVLNDVEASIVTPFTTKSQSIRSVVDLCREGRCSLVTSFAAVKYMFLLGLISSTLRLLQYYNGIIMSEYCWIYCNFFNILFLTYFIVKSHPLPSLTLYRPTSSLIGFTTLSSLFGQQLINIFFFSISIRYLTQQIWYCSFSSKGLDLQQWWIFADNPMATCAFYCVIFQQQTAAFVYSFGGYFRLPVWKNYGLCSCLFILFSFNFFFMFSSSNFITELLQLATGTNVIGLPYIPIPIEFRIQYLKIILANIIVSIIFHSVFINGYVAFWLRKKFHKSLVLKL